MHVAKRIEIFAGAHVAPVLRSCQMACQRYFFPPYYRIGIFFFCGIELAWNALVMAINQKYWDLSTKIFPTAFKMFNDTLEKGVPRDYGWGDAQMFQLTMYQYKLTLMWFVSTLIILATMLCIVPQFCTFENSDGDEITYCVKKPITGYIIAPLLLLLVAFGGIVLVWQWASCQQDYELFQGLFRQSQKEEAFLTELEQQLHCILDDDKEVEHIWECDNMIDRSMINSRWLNPMLAVYAALHFVMVVGFPFFNRDFSCCRMEPSGCESADSSECKEPLV